MKRMRHTVGSLTTVLVLAALPAIAQDEAKGIKEELQALVRAATRLVESLERQEKAQLSDRDLVQIQIGVRLLDIRMRQQESLQKRLESLDDWEQRLNGSIASNKIRLENSKKQLAEAVDESKRLELEAQREVRVVYLKNQESELEYLAQRRATLESRIIDGERSVLEIEDMVQGWVAGVQNPSPERQER